MSFFIWHTLIILFVFFWGVCLGLMIRRQKKNKNVSQTILRDKIAKRSGESGQECASRPTLQGTNENTDPVGKIKKYYYEEI